MSPIQDYFSQAQLALAAYANLQGGNPNTVALQDGGMSLLQANRFASDWTVVTQFTHSESHTYVDETGSTIVTTSSNGLSATVFQDKSGKRYLAVRGTDDLNDVWTDITDIAIFGTPERQAQYSMLKAKVNEWIGDGTLPPSFSVTGHSLGGFLAGALLVDFPAAIEHAYLYNAPGVGGLVASIRLLLGLESDPSIGLSKVSNLRADAGISPIAGLGLAWGTPIPIAIENQLASDVTGAPAARNHSQQVLVDALAVYGIFDAVQPGIGVDTVSTLIKAASPKASDTLEISVLSLGKLFLLTPPSISTTDRNTLYKAIYDIRTALSSSGGATFVSLTAKTADGLKGLAVNGDVDALAYRYALKELNPFAVLGIDYNRFNQNGELDLTDPASGQGDLSTNWIDDRSAMLAWVIKTNLTDSSNTYVDTSLTNNWSFVDRGTGQVIHVDRTTNTPTEDQRRQVVFGSDTDNTKTQGHDVLTGGYQDDRLYGMSGNDTLRGGGGADTLEGGRGLDALYGDAGADTLDGGLDNDILVGGADNDTLNGGAGLDTYIWNSTPGYFGWNWRLGATNDGADQIIDADKRGRILINGQGIKALLKQPDGTWTTPDGKVTLAQAAGRWKLDMDGGSLDLGTSFTDGNYGIRRLETPADMLPSKKGDLKPIDFEPDVNGSTLRYDDLNNVKVSGVASLGRADTLYGSTGNDRIQGLGGDDVLIGQGGNDILEGGSGSDVVKGSGGNDLVLGAGQITVAAAYAAGKGDSSSTAQGDWLDGGADDDVLLGGAAEDALTGGDGADLLIGGAGNDLLMGDATLTSTRTDWRIDRQIIDNETETSFINHYTNADVQDAPATGGDDAMYGGKGDDWAFGGGGDDLIDGGDDNDVLMGEAGNDVLLGGQGNDTLDGDSADVPLALQGDDWLDGGAGNDALFGDAGDDVLIGGTGNDTMYGGDGRDTYVFNKGDGIDEIWDDSTGDEASILVLGEGVDKDDIVLHKGSLLLDLGGGDGIHIENFNYIDPMANASFSAFQFADGSSLSWSELLARGFDLDGTAGDDTIYGTGVDDRLRGFAGSDMIYGLAGNDILDGGAGIDGLAGGLGDDIYLMRAGEAQPDFANDRVETIVEQGGSDTLRFEGIARMAVNFWLDDTEEFLVADSGTDRVQITTLGGGDVRHAIERFEFAGGERLELNDLPVKGRTVNSAQTGAVLTGSWANDILRATNAGATIIAGQGADKIWATAGSATINGGQGNDTIQALGTGNTLRYSVGDGSDHVTTTAATVTGNVLKLSGVTSDDVTAVLGPLLEVELRIGSKADDRIRFDGFDAGNASGQRPFDRIEFDDGSTLDFDALMTRGVAISGTEGNDTVRGLGGNDRIAGLGGDDSLSGGAGEDILDGGTGNDILDGELDDDTLAGGPGLDVLQGGAGNDRYIFKAGDGEDSVIDLAGNNAVEFGAGLLATGLTVSQRQTDGGADWLDLDFGNGDRLSIWQGELDRVQGFRFADGEVLSTVDLLASMPGVSLTGDATANTLQGYTGDDVLRGLGGNDLLNGGAGNDSLDGGTGNDLLRGGEGTDSYRLGFGTGQDRIEEGAGETSEIHLDAGISFDSLQVVRSGSDVVLKLRVTGDSVRLTDYAAGNWLVIQPNGTTQSIVELMARPVLTGEAALQQVWRDMEGAALVAATGSNRPHFVQNAWGANFVYESDYGPADSPFIWTRMASKPIRETTTSEIRHIDINESDVQHLDVGGTDVVLVENGSYLARASAYTLERMDAFWIGKWSLGRSLYANGVVLSSSVVADTSRALDLLYGNQIDTIVTTNTQHNVVGEIQGDSRNNTIMANEQFDHQIWDSWSDGYIWILKDNQQIDLVDGGAGDDTLAGNEGDLLYGNDGNDSLYGGTGTQTLIGGRGTDLMNGGMGADVYQVLLEDSVDTIDDRGTDVLAQPPYLHADDYRELEAYYGNGIDADRVVLPAGVSFDNIRISGNEDTGYLLLDWPDGAGLKIALAKHDWAVGSGVELFEFADGTVVTIGDMVDRMNVGRNVEGTTADDRFVFGKGADVVHAGAGDDVVNTGGGDDLLEGGTGDDTLAGGAGDDVYLFKRGDGHDTISQSTAATTDHDVIRFGAGIAAAQVLVGRDAGGIHLTVAGSTDSITILEQPGAAPLPAVEFADGTRLDSAVLFAAPWEIRSTDEGGYVWGTDGNEIMIGGAGSDTLIANGGDDLIFGYGSNDVLQGGAGNDVIDGGADNDELFGMEGNDTLAGGTGNDRLVGGPGDDVFLFGRGDGFDIIDLEAIGSGSHDVIRFGADITPDDLIFYRDRQSFTVGIAGTTDILSLRGQFDQLTMPSVEFANGTRWDASVLASMPFQMRGTLGGDTLRGDDDGQIIYGLGGDDTLFGNGGDDFLQGGNGADYLYGGPGNDVLDGGAGNDFLASEAGDDVYLFGRGDGADIVFVSTGSGGADTLHFKPGVAPGDVTLVKYSSGYKLTINDTGDSILLAADVPLSRVEFSDGTLWDGSVLAIAPSYKQGSAGADSLGGTAGADYLAGLGGNDSLFGSAGNDVLEGGTGNDELYGDAGNDVFLFGRGDGADTIYQSTASAGDNDVIRFKAGVRPSDVVLTRDGVTDNGGVRLTIRDTGDSIGILGQGQGSAGFTTYNVPRVEFADGTVWAASMLRSVVAYFTGTNADESLGFTAGPDRISGLQGNDWLTGGAGDDVLDGGAGLNALQGGAGNDVYLIDRSAGEDWVFQGDAVAGDVDVVRFAADVKPEDVIRIQWGDHLALLDPDSGRLVVLAYWSNAPIDQNRVARVEFADGTIWDQATLGGGWLSASIVIRGDGNEGFAGGSGIDVMLGRRGDDSLSGNAGDDILIGGEGNDSLNGGTGSDTFIVGRGQGSDYITATYDGGQQDVDVVRFAPGVSAADIVVSREYSDLKLTIRDTGENTTVAGWFYLAFTGNQAPRIVFADGTELDANVLKATPLVVTGTESADTLYGSSQGDRFYGLGGNDSLVAGDGNDLLDGGSGDDWLYGGAGNDTFVVGRGGGNDTVFTYDSSSGDADTVLFAAGVAMADVAAVRRYDDLLLTIKDTGETTTVQSWFTAASAPRIAFADGGELDSVALRALPSTLTGTGADDWLNGTAADEVLLGLGGNDHLRGGAGNDTYRYGPGGGTDTINQAGNGLGNGENDVLLFDPGIDPADVVVTMWNDELSFSLEDGGSVTVGGWSDGGALASVRFADGTAWNTSDVEARIVVPPGTDDEDFIVGTDAANVIDGLAGDDEIYGRGGDDVLSGDQGNDELVGGDGNDMLEGGVGNDYLSGGAGNDVYAFGRGDGIDQIDQYDALQTDADVIRLAADISPADVRLLQEGDDFAVWIRGTSDLVVVSADMDTPFPLLPNVEFADGVVWTIDEWADTSSRLLRGNASSNWLSGANSDDVIFGLAGNDVLHGSDGNDVLIGGFGFDRLYGDGGDDTYVFNAGDGNDSIYNYRGETSIGHDVVQFGEGILSEVISVRGVDVDGSVAVSLFNQDTEDSVTIFGDLAGLPEVRFVNGTVWNGDTLRAMIVNTTGTENADLLIGTGGDDILQGGVGYDTIFGFGGNDILSGGPDGVVVDGGSGGVVGGGSGGVMSSGGRGFDWLRGGAGDDVYLFNRGDGTDWISNWDAGHDVIRFGADIASADVAFTTSEAGYLLSIVGTDDVITIESGMTTLPQVAFADGTIWDRATLLSMVTNNVGTEGGDLLVSTTARPVLDGGAGDDTYFVGSSSPNTHIVDASGTDTLILDGINLPDISLGVGSLKITVTATGQEIHLDDFDPDNPYAEGGIEYFRFADGIVLTKAELIDTLGFRPTGTSGDDVFSGTSLNDVITGLGGNDTLVGRGGNDTLDGGSGDDTYSYAAGDGHDQIADEAGVDRIVFGAGILATQVSVFREEGEVVLSLSETDSIRFAENSPGNYAIERVEFGDGTVWQAADVLRQLSKTPPTVAVALDDQAATEDSVFRFTVPVGSFADVDGAAGDTLIYAAGLADGSALPGWLAFDAATQTFSGTPDNGAVGNLRLRVTATDLAGSSVSSGFTVSIANTNDTPVATLAIPNQSAHQNDAFLFVVPSAAFADVDIGDSLALSARLANGSPLPAWLSFDGATGRLTGTPARADAGALQVVVTATDLAGAAVSQAFVLTVGATLTGTAGNDFLTGSLGNDLLDGGAGRDRMTGGTGNDIYLVDNTGDVVVELPGEGIDTVQSSVSLTLAANVENLTLLGTANISATGNALGNLLIGNSGSNTLNGGADADTMIGGLGNDTYYVDSTGDVVTEAIDEGTDRVISGISYILGAQVENLTLTGTEAINGTGNELNNTVVGNSAGNVLSGLGGNDSLNGGIGGDSLFGGDGNDTLNGNAGDDNMAGGLGNDTYYVDSTGDVVTEAIDEGTDRVMSSISYTLGAQVENLTLTGTEAINGTGNELNNTIVGNSAGNILSGMGGNDTLNGNAGDDSMAGGLGNDTYYVDSTGDVVTEAVDEGTDRVISSISYTLGAQVENLTLTGTEAINGTGNELNNTIVGNGVGNALSGLGGNDSLSGGIGSDSLFGGDGNDTLNGNAGDDSMAGGLGNDTYYVDSTGDVVSEAVDEGTDRVISSISYILGAQVENLTLTGTEAINGTGNELNNSIAGNSAGNVLSGLGGNDILTGNAGDDTLDGGAGADRLTGGQGSDIYQLGRGSGADIIVENDAAAGNADVAQFLAGIEADQIWLRHVGNSLEASVIGTADKLTVQNWYLGEQYHVEQFKTAGGKLLLDSQVENLVQAMAAFAPPAAGQTTLPPAYQDTLAPVIAANWH